MPKTNKLTIKQEKFCAKYVECGNAAAAYRYAYAASKSKQESIHRMATALTQNLMVASRINELKQKLLDKLAVSPEKTLKRLMQGQEFDIRKMYHPGGALKLPHELDDDTAKAVVGVKYDSQGQVEYKIIDVKGCTELVGKHLGLFTDKHVHSWDGDCPLSALVEQARNLSKGLPTSAPEDDD